MNSKEVKKKKRMRAKAAGVFKGTKLKREEFWKEILTRGILKE